MTQSPGSAQVGILMGSANDYDVMKPAESVLTELGVASDVRVISAHRTPQRLVVFLANAEARGIRVVICGAGGAAIHRVQPRGALLRRQPETSDRRQARPGACE